jgi:Bacterial Ig-like domain
MSSYAQTVVGFVAQRAPDVSTTGGMAGKTTQQVKFAIEAKTTHRNSGLETPREQGDDMRNWVLTGCATLLAAVLTACPTTASKPEITAFSGTPTTVKASGTIVTLTWTTTGATDVALSAVPALATGQATVSTGTATVKDVKTDTKFTLTAKNAAGDSVTKDFSVTLEAATGVAPKILSSVPDNAATGVDIDKNTITVTFDKAMDLATTKAALTLNGGTAANLVLSADLKTATITFTPTVVVPVVTPGAGQNISYTFANTAKSTDGGTLAAVTRTYTSKKLVLLTINAAVAVPGTPATFATTLSGSAIRTFGTGLTSGPTPCSTAPCSQNSFEAEIRAGDNKNSVKGDNAPLGLADTANPNYAYKGFIGFNLPVALTGLAPADVVSAKVTATQLPVAGTPYTMGTLKIQSITSADLVGKFTDADQYFFYGAPTNAGLSFDFSLDGAVGPKTAVVTSAVVADLTNKGTYGNRSLFRIMFPRKATTTLPAVLADDNAPGDTDGDNDLDVAVFENPKLEVVYTQP